MKSYVINRGNFENFFIHNFEEIKNINFSVMYKFLDDNYAIRYYRHHRPEGIAFLCGDEHSHEYIALVVHNDLKIEQIINLNEFEEGWVI